MLVLVRAVAAQYAQAVSWQSTVAYFEHTNSTLSLKDYLNRQEMTPAVAREFDRLELDHNGRTCFMLREAQQNKREDYAVRLRINGDLNCVKETLDLLQLRS